MITTTVVIEFCVAPEFNFTRELTVRINFLMIGVQLHYNSMTVNDIKVPTKALQLSLLALIEEKQSANYWNEDLPINAIHRNKKRKGWHERMSTWYTKFLITDEVKRELLEYERSLF